MSARQDGDVDLGWVRGLLRGMIVAAVGVAGLGASCVEPAAPGGDTGHGEDSGARTDAAATGGCRSIAGAESCRRRAECQWLTATCQDGRTVGGCYAGSGWRDVEPDCSTVADTGAAPGDAVSADCGTIETEEGCRTRDACKWWTRSCGGRLVSARCIDRAVSPDSPACTRDAGDASGAEDVGTSADTGTATGDVAGPSDASADAADLDTSVYCRMHSNKSDCRTDSRCQWWVDSCDGYVIEKTCISVQESPTPTTCKQIRPVKCHDIDQEGNCRPPNCEWVAEGCGSGPTGTTEVTACLPEGTCQVDSDCPSNHRCIHLWTDVCHGSACQACGGETKRCVATDLLSP